MAANTFTYTVDFGARLQESPRVIEVRFGDGYAQRLGNGLNLRPREWALTFNARTQSEMTPILSFLQSRNGIEAFNWTDPDGVSGVWVCKQWTHSLPRFGTSDLSATFFEVFGE